MGEYLKTDVHEETKSVNKIRQFHIDVTVHLDNS